MLNKLNMSEILIEALELLLEKEVNDLIVFTNKLKGGDNSWTNDSQVSAEYISDRTAHRNEKIDEIFTLLQDLKLESNFDKCSALMKELKDEYDCGSDELDLDEYLYQNYRYLKLEDCKRIITTLKDI